MCFTVSKGFKTNSKVTMLNCNYSNLQVIVKAAEVMIVSDEEHLGPASGALDVGGDEAQDVLVPEEEDDEVDDKEEEEDHNGKMAMMMSNDSPHQDCLVDLSFSEPARLFRCEEHLAKKSV